MQASISAKWRGKRNSAKNRAMAGPESTEKIGERLRLTRLALGFSKQVEICRALGDEGLAQAWNNWERGRERISVDYALSLCRRFRLSLDWIYLGEDGLLPSKLQKQISDLASKSEKPLKRA